jgi:lysophospholipase L1-like esterase
MSWYRLTVLGDSFSVGWGDPAPDGKHRGWVPRFCSSTNLPPDSVQNLARYGATTRHAVSKQLPLVIGATPLVVVLVGINDLLSDDEHYDAARFQNNLRTLFDAFGGADTMVVTSSYPDIPGNLRVSESTRRSLRARFSEGNDALEEIAEEAGVLRIDVCRTALWRDGSLWAPDRLHPGPRLHESFVEELVSATQNCGLLAAY